MRCLPICIVLMFVGCGKPPPPTQDSGARDATREFFEGLVTRDPTRAYAVLDPESCRRVTPAQFAKLARSYVENMGFSADKVHIRACEEHGDSATAHVTLIGTRSGHTHRHSDGATLRRAEGRWCVILPAKFAQKTR